MVGQGDLPRPGVGVAAPGHAPGGDGVVGRTEGPLGEQGCSLLVKPITEWIWVASRASRRVMGGRMEGRRRASMLFPDPGGPIMAALWPRRRRFPAPASLAPGPGPPRNRGRAAPPALPDQGGAGRWAPPGEVGGQLLHRLHWVDGEPLGQGGLRGVVGGDVQPLDARLLGGQSHGEHPHHRPQGCPTGRAPPQRRSGGSNQVSWPAAARIPTRMGRSYIVPDFRRLAGARLTVIRPTGKE